MYKTGIQYESQRSEDKHRENEIKGIFGCMKMNRAEKKDWIKDCITTEIDGTVRLDIMELDRGRLDKKM